MAKFTPLAPVGEPSIDAMTDMQRWEKYGTPSAREAKEFTSTPGPQTTGTGRFTPITSPEPTGDFQLQQRALQRMLGTDLASAEQSEALRAARIASGTVLGTTGAIMGARTPLGPGGTSIVINPLVGSAVGGAAGWLFGTLAPQMSMQFAENVGLLEPGTTEKYGLPWQDLKRVAIGEAALDLHFGLIGHIPRMLGRLATFGMTHPGRPFVTDASTGQKQTGRQLAEEAKGRLGVELLPWQVGEGVFGRGLLTVMGKFPMVGSPARGPILFHRRRFIQGQKQTEEQAIKALKETSAKIGEVKGMSDLSEAILSDATHLRNSLKQRFNLEYQQVWKLADQHGVQISPRLMKEEATKVLSEIADEAPKAKRGGRPMVDKSFATLAGYLTSNVLGMKDVQRLVEFDTAIENLDRFMKSLEPAQQNNIRRHLNRVRNAGLQDVTQSLVGSDPRKASVVQRLREVDAKYHETMATIFETSIAQRFGSVKRHGIRGFSFVPATQTPVGQLAETLIELDDPRSIDDLFKLVSPDTRRSIAASMVEVGISKSWEQVAKPGMLGTGPTVKFNTQAFDNFFGFGATPEALSRNKAIGKMLKDSGSPLTLDDLRVLSRTMNAIASFSVSDASAFVARRAQLGGAQAILTSFGGGLATAGAGGAAGAASSGGDIVGSIAGSVIAFVGVRGLIRAITNPSGAKHFRTAMKEDAALGVRRASVLRLMHAAFELSADDMEEADIPNDTVRKIRDFGADYVRDAGRALRILEKDGIIK